MSALTKHIEELFRELELNGIRPPTRDVRIIEPYPLKNGKYHVRHGEIQTISEYEPRFDEVLRSGSSWVHVDCEGTYDNYLIVSVTFNREEHCVGEHCPSVMLSWSTAPVTIINEAEVIPL